MKLPRQYAFRPRIRVLRTLMSTTVMVLQCQFGSTRIHGPLQSLLRTASSPVQSIFLLRSLIFYRKINLVVTSFRFFVVYPQYPSLRLFAVIEILQRCPPVPACREDLPSIRLDNVVSALAVTMPELVARSRGFGHGIYNIPASKQPSKGL